jgi:prefoldin beta subunit
MSNTNPKTEKQIQEMQILEQNLQNILMQKQAFQMELTETKSASEEIENSQDDVYKIIGSLMIKTEKAKIKEELTNKEKLLSIRLGSLEKQEENFSEKLEELRQ